MTGSRTRTNALLVAAVMILAVIGGAALFAAPAVADDVEEVDTEEELRDAATGETTTAGDTVIVTEDIELSGSGIAVTVDDITVQSAEDSPTTISNDADSTAKTIRIDADGVVVQDLTIERSDHSDDGGVAHGIRVAGSNVEIRDNEVVGTNLAGSDAGVQVLDDGAGLTGVTIEDNEIHGFGSGASAVVDSGGSIAGVSITGNHIHDTESAIPIGETDRDAGNELVDVSVHENTIDNNEYGVYVLGEGDEKPEGLAFQDSTVDLVVDDNEFTNQGDTNIQVQFGGQVDITNNDITGGDSGGIIQADGEVTATGNTIEDVLLGLDIYTTDATPITVNNNTIDVEGELAIFVHGTATVTENTVDAGEFGASLIVNSPETVTVSKNQFAAGDLGIRLNLLEADTGDVDITKNDITENNIGVLVAAADGDTDRSDLDININENNIEENENNIEENEDFGVKNEVDDIVVDATDNWWGDSSGPSGEGPGGGDAVSENVDFDPFLTSPFDVDSAVINSDIEVQNIEAANGQQQQIGAGTHKLNIELNRDDVDQLDIIIGLDVLAAEGIDVAPNGDVEVVEFEADGTQEADSTFVDDENELRVSVGTEDNDPIGDGDDEITVTDFELLIDAGDATSTDDPVEYSVDLANAEQVDTGDSLASVNAAETGKTFPFGISEATTGSISGAVSFTDALLEEPTSNPVTVEITANDGTTEHSEELEVDAMEDTSPVEYTIANLDPTEYDVTATVTAVDDDEARADEVDIVADDGPYDDVSVTGGENTDGQDFSLEVDEEPSAVEIQHARTTAGAIATAPPAATHAEELRVKTVDEDERFEVGGDTTTAFRISPVDSDAAVTAIPDSAESFEANQVNLGFYDPDGGIDDPGTITVVNPDFDDAEFIDVTVEGDESVFTESVFESYEIELIEDVNTEDEAVVDSTDERFVSIGYEGTLEQSDTTGDATLTFSRDAAVDESWDVQIVIYDEQATDPEIRQRLENDADDEEFTAQVDFSELDAGNYSYRLSMYPDESLLEDGATDDQTGFFLEDDAELGDRIIQPFGVEEITVDGEAAPPEIENVQVDTDRTNDAVTVSADVTAGDTDIEEVALGLGAEFTSFNATEAPDQDTTEGELSATIDVDELVGDGDYIAGAAALDAAGNEVIEFGDGVTVDTTPPAIQPRVDDLGEETATLRIDADEEIRLTDLEIEATADGDSEIRDPDDEIPEGLQESFEIEFDGEPIDAEDTTFTIDIEAEDDLGNAVDDSLQSTITGYEIEDGLADVDPPVNSAFGLNADADEVGDDTERSAVVAEGNAPPAGTELDDDQIAGQFIDVDEIGLTDEELENATIRIPLDAIDIEEFDAEELTILRSADGEAGYEPIDTEIEDDELVADVDEFSQFTPAGTDDEPPTIDDVTVDPASSLGAEEGPVTVTFEYSPVISDIDVSATTVDVDVADERVDVQTTDTSTEVTIDGLTADENIEVDLTVVDEAGNAASETETIAVQDADDETETDTTTTAGGGGGGPAAPPSPTTVAGISTSISDTAPDQPGTTVRIGQTVVNSVTFSNDDARGTVSVDEFDDVPPSAPALDADRPALAAFEIDVPADHADESATFEVTIPRERLTDAGVEPEELVVLRAVENEYQTLEAGVTVADDAVTLEVETPGFSTFVVSTAVADDDDDAADETTPTDTESEETDTPTEPPETEEPAEDQVGFGIAVALVSLLAATLLAARRRE